MDEKITQKQPITLQELSKYISAINKKDLIPIQQKIFDFAKKFSKITPGNAEKLRAELKKLDVTRLTDEHISDIVNFMPGDLSELKTLFVKTNTTLPPEDFKRISDLINKYKK